MKPILSASLMAALLVAVGSQAQIRSDEHAGHHPPAGNSGTQAATDFVQGEVRRVDTDAKKLTLRHGPIPNLEMPEMTMVFQVVDESVLQGLKTGDTVRFKADRIGGQYTVTSLEPVR